MLRLLGWRGLFILIILTVKLPLEIQEGKVAIELIRPYNYLGMKTMQGIRRRDFSLCFSFLFQEWLLSALIFPIKLSANLTDVDVSSVSHCI